MPAPVATGLKALVIYKAARGGVQLLAGIVLGIAVALGKSEWLHDWVTDLHSDVTSAFALWLTNLLLAWSTPTRLALTATALGVDGAFCGLEAYLLHTGRHWALQVVIFFTTALIPWEIAELWMTGRRSRLVLLILNTAVLFYLVWQSRRQDEHKPTVG